MTQQNTAYYLRVLHELIEIGTDFARQLHRLACPPADASQPATPPSPAAAQDLSIAFDRIARTIRRTIALAQKLSEPVNAQPAPRFGQNGARKRNLRAVDDSFQPDEAEVDPAKLTDKELAERIDRLKLELDLDDLDDDDFADRPIVDIIADICRDLGIARLPDTHPGKRRIIADLALLITSPQAQALRSELSPAAAPSAAPNTDSVVTIHAHPCNADSKSTDPPPIR